MIGSQYRQENRLLAGGIRAPYFTFLDASVDITVCSPKSGQPPVDPKSDTPEGQTKLTERFKGDAGAQRVLANTAVLADMNADDYDAVFYPGGHGPLWDLAEDAHSIAVIERFYESGKPVAFVCHAPGVLRHVEVSDEPLVKGARVSGLTNSEEEAVQLTNVVPFLVEANSSASAAVSRESRTGSAVDHRWTFRAGI